MLELVRDVRVFDGLPKRALRQVVSLADEIDLPAERQLAQEGERGRELLVMLAGAADVRQNGHLVNLLGNGDVVGEIALVAERPHTATVTTTSPARALVLDGRDFRILRSRWPQLRASVDALIRSYSS